MSSDSEVQAIGEWANNAEMIADVARLGYLDGTVLDATYGDGGFWKVWRPVGPTGDEGSASWSTLTTNDLHRPADLRDSYLDLSLPDGAFDVVVFDPPYKLNGTPALGEQDERYGTTRRTSRAEVLDDIRCGALECYRVCSKRLLVKCMDQVEGGRKRWQTDIVTRAIEDAGGRKIDRFDIALAGRPQPGGRVQRTSRSKHSTLLVFAKPAGA